MESWFIGLVVLEVIIIAIVIIVKIVIHKRGERTVDKILNYFYKRAEETDSTDKFEECIKVIRENQKKDG